jgi:hypothetical protein
VIDHESIFGLAQLDEADAYVWIPPSYLAAIAPYQTPSPWLPAEASGPQGEASECAQPPWSSSVGDLPKELLCTDVRGLGVAVPWTELATAYDSDRRSSDEKATAEAPATPKIGRSQGDEVSRGIQALDVPKGTGEAHLFALRELHRLYHREAALRG